MRSPLAPGVAIPGPPGQQREGYSDLRQPSLAVASRKMADGGPDWEETAADMRDAIATLTDTVDTAMTGRFKRDNRCRASKMDA